MLSQAHRRSIHTSLAPIIGEEETDALMSQFPARESDMPATKADLALLGSEVEKQFLIQQAHLDDKFRQMVMWMVSTIVVAMIGGMGVAAAISSAGG